MKTKLQQMNNVLTGVIEKMNDDTILIVQGTMVETVSSKKVVEMSSAMWIYCKCHTFIDTSLSVHLGHLQFKTFPEITHLWYVQQRSCVISYLSKPLGGELDEGWKYI